MKKSLFSALAVVLAFSCPALAGTDNSATNNNSQPTGAAPSQTGAAPSQGSASSQQDTSSAIHSSNVLTINKLKQDLQKAGFTDVKVLADSFVIQAKDKNGDPTIMSLSPSGVFAISALSQERQAKASNSGSSSSNKERHE